MKEYFLRFITGRIGVFWSFFNHFILLYLLGFNLFLLLDDKMIDDYPSFLLLFLRIFFFCFVLLVGIAFVGTMVSAVRTLVSGGEPFFHRIFSGLVIVLLSVLLYYTIVDCFPFRCV